MASALQKFFRKRISKQQQGKARREADGRRLADDHSRFDAHWQDANGELAGQLRHSSETDTRSSHSARPVLTVNSLRSALDSPLTFDHHEGGRTRSASLGAHAMLRGYSNGSRSSWLGTPSHSQLAGSSMHVDQFGLVVPESELAGLPNSSLGHGTSTESAEEDGRGEYDVEDNPLYQRLTQSDSLSRAWSTARLVVLPAKRNTEDLPLDQDTYVGLHALVPSHLFKDQYVSTSSEPQMFAQLDDKDGLPQPAQPLDAPGDSEEDTTDSGWDKYSVTVTLNSESQSVHWLVSRLTGSQKTTVYEQSLRVSNETTVYRTVCNGEGIRKATKKERIKVRVVTVDGIVVPQRMSGPSAKEHVELGSEVPSSAASIAFPSREPSMDPLRSPTVPDMRSDQPPCSAFSLAQVPTARHFFADLSKLLDPSSQYAGPFAEALRFVTRATAEFTSAYVYVPGFDAYNVSRIRRGILAKVWVGLEAACRVQEQKVEGEFSAATTALAAKASEGSERFFSAEDRSQLLLLLENVVLGYCHGKIYGSIRASQWQADDGLDGIIATYHDCDVTMGDLQVQPDSIRGRPELFDRAVRLLGCLGDPEEDFDYLLSFPDPPRIRAFAEKGTLPTYVDAWTDAPPSAYQQCGRVRMRTPLDTLDVLKAIIDEIGAVVERTQMQSSRTGIASLDLRKTKLGTDDLLPLLSYVVVRAAPRRLHSLLYYVRAFGISDATSAELNWALVNTEAVVEYLRNDPLHLCAGSSMTKYSSSRSECASPTESDRYQGIRLPSRGSEKDLSSLRGKPWELGRPLSADRLDSNRQRRSSLPSNVALSSALDTTDNNLLVRTDSLPRSRTPSSSTSPVRNSAGFKVPGRPASAVAPGLEDVRRRGGVARASKLNGSALDRVGEDSLSTETSATSSTLFASGSAGMHRRTSSSSATGDLSIRSQIVVRPRRQAAHSTSSSERAISPTFPSPQEPIDPHQDPQPRIVGSRSTIGLADREEREATSGAEARLGRLSIDERRKSIDSWMSLNILGTPMRSTNSSEGEARSQSVRASAATRRPQTTRSLTGVNSPSQTPSFGPSNMSESGSSGTLASPSLSWLPAWPAESWGHRKSFTSDSGSRPQSVGSIEGLFPASQSGSGFATIPSSTSSHNLASSPESTANAGRTLKATASVRSNSSQSSGSHAAEDIAFVAPERRRRRSRLLSNSSHSALVPPQLVAGQGASASFVGSSTFSWESTRSGAGESLAAAVGRPISPRSSPMSTPTTQHPTAPLPVSGESETGPSTLSPPPIPFSRTLSMPYLGSTNSHVTSLSPESYFPPLFRIQVPSPVAEISDPLSAHTPRQLLQQQQQQQQQNRSTHRLPEEDVRSAKMGKAAVAT